MTTRRLLAGGLATLLSGVPLGAHQATGTISGQAVDEARRPYTNYQVQLRDVANGQVAQTVPLTDQGRFSAVKLPLETRYLVELVDLRARKIVCSEGPYLLASSTSITREDVNIDCGMTPAALWLILAGAGTATTVAVTQASPSR